VDFNGDMDRWEYYLDGILFGMEIDNSGDGVPDEWCYFKNGRKCLAEKDVNCDGIIETIIH